MTIETTRRTAMVGFGLAAAASTTLLPSMALAKSDVQVKNHVVSARGLKFDPMFVYVEPGDRVSFENMSSHNVETIEVMSPKEQDKILSEFGENVFYSFEHVGIIVYKCTPHWGNRMGGIIVVGKPENPAGIIDGYLALTDKPEHSSELPARGLLKKLKRDMQKRGMIT